MECFVVAMPLEVSLGKFLGRDRSNSYALSGQLITWSKNKPVSHVSPLNSGLWRPWKICIQQLKAHFILHAWLLSMLNEKLDCGLILSQVPPWSWWAWTSPPKMFQHNEGTSSISDRRCRCLQTSPSTPEEEKTSRFSFAISTTPPSPHSRTSVSLQSITFSPRCFRWMLNVRGQRGEKKPLLHHDQGRVHTHQNVW